MRVLFITGEFPPMQGGVGDCTYEIAKATRALAADVQVITSIQASAPYHESFVVRSMVESWTWASLGVISRTVREFSPDVVHIQFQTAAFGMHPAIYFLPRFLSILKLQVRPVVTFHDLLPPYLFPKAGPVRDWITRELARSCVAVIATNEPDYLKLQNLRLKNLSLIPIGSNIPVAPPPNYERNDWRAGIRVAENETLICYFGFLNESKGGETLIRALAMVPDAKLIMIGGQTGASDPTNVAYLARVKGLVAELGVSDRVLWTGYTPPEIVTANFLASDICVQPYREGASFRHGTLMAALAHGMAIVTTIPRENTALQESPWPRLQNEENCLLVPPENPGALADAIRRASASPSLRAKIGAGARELAGHFSWGKIAQQHQSLYKLLMEESVIPPIV